MFTASSRSPAWPRRDHAPSQTSRGVRAMPGPNHSALHDARSRASDIVADPLAYTQNKSGGWSGNRPQNHTLCRPDVEAQPSLSAAPAQSTNNDRVLYDESPTKVLRRFLRPKVDEAPSAQNLVHTRPQDQVQNGPGGRLDKRKFSSSQIGEPPRDEATSSYGLPIETSLGASLPGSGNRDRLQGIPKKRPFADRLSTASLAFALPREARNSMSAPVFSNPEDEHYTTSAPRTGDAFRPQQTMGTPASAVPRQLPHSEQQLLEQIQDWLCEQGLDVHSRVSGMLKDDYEMLAKKVSEVSTEDEEVLEQSRALISELRQPLEESLTYQTDSQDPPSKLGGEIASTRHALAEFQQFLDNKWKEWDAAKAAEDDAFVQVVHGLNDSGGHAEEADGEFKKLRREIKELEAQALEEMRACFEEFEKDRRKVDEKQRAMMWDGWMG